MKKERKRETYILHKFSAKIDEIKQSKSFHYPNEIIYKVGIKGKRDIKKITVRQKEVNEEVWKKITEEDCIDKKFTFSCFKIGSSYHLKELSDKD